MTLRTVVRFPSPGSAVYRSHAGGQAFWVTIFVKSANGRANESEAKKPFCRIDARSLRRDDGLAP
jgi:hypothetical protein